MRVVRRRRSAAACVRPASIQSASLDLARRPRSAKLDSLRGSSVKIGTMQRRLAWPLRKDDTHKSRSVNKTRKRRVGSPRRLAHFRHGAVRSLVWGVLGLGPPPASRVPWSRFRGVGLCFRAFRSAAAQCVAMSPPCARARGFTDCLSEPSFLGVIQESNRFRRTP